MRVADWPAEPDLSTWLETGTFYLAPTPLFIDDTLVQILVAAGLGSEFGNRLAVMVGSEGFARIGPSW